MGVVHIRAMGVRFQGSVFVSARPEVLQRVLVVDDPASQKPGHEGKKSVSPAN